MTNNIKNILVISRNVYPHISARSFRTTELVKELARQGHKVTLYIVKDNPILAKLEKEWGVRIKDLGKIRFKDISINSQLRLVKQFQRGIRRLFLLLCEYPDIELMFKVKRVLKNEKDYDLLISIAVPYPLHWGVAWARTKRHRIAQKWVADCGDPYMGNTHDSFRKFFYFKYVEKWSFRKTDYISIPRIEMKSTHYPEFHNKIIAIPQGFKFKVGSYKKNYTKNKIITFAFAGNFMPTTRNPIELLEYLSSLNINFKFINYTNTPNLLLPYKNKLGEKLIINNYIPREDLLEVLSRMDFLINIGFDAALASPSKLIDYALTDRPILNIDSQFKPEIVDEFLDGNYKHRFAVPDLEKYNISNVAQQFLELTPNMK